MTQTQTQAQYQAQNTIAHSRKPDYRKAQKEVIKNYEFLDRYYGGNPK